MVLKTFNVQEDIYAKFSAFCRENGLSMSKQVSNFMAYMTQQEPEAKKEYLQKLDKIRKGQFTHISDFAGRYGL